MTIFEKLQKAKLFSSFTQLQVDSINAIMNECELQGVTDKRQIAYIYATAYHEGYDYDGVSTGKVQRLVPIKEKGSQAYLRGKPYYPYIGYGYVMLTWKNNFVKFDKIIKSTGRFNGVDIMANPIDLLRVGVAAFVIVYGMKHGSYTGVCLDDYFNAKCTNATSARKIVNGMDKASTIKGYWDKFYKALI